MNQKPELLTGRKRRFAKFAFWGVLGACIQATCFGQISITGVADKAFYSDQVSFTVSPAPGWTYSALLDAVPVPVGSGVLVNDVDYHELFVARTNDTTLAVETRLVRFVVRSSERVGTEDGLPPWTPPPMIPSTAEEFSGAQLQVLTPASFPIDAPIPVVAWVRDTQGHTVRANGRLTANGEPSITIKRGVGSGFLATNHPMGTLEYKASIAGLETNRSVLIESNTVWQTVSGTLGGNTAWPANTRIQITNLLTISAGATLNIGAGTLVRLDGNVDIKLDGALHINGTVDEPVVFFPTRANQPWGGFLLERNSSQLQATGAIFTGSGAVPNWFGSNGRPGSHRTEQALFYCTNAPAIVLTDCAAIQLAGQFGHSVNGGSLTLTRFLMQRVTSGGEFTGAHFVVNDSALMDCPDDSVDFVDGDNDALYLVNGTHGFTNTLFGWTKDDGVDSGGSGAGLIDFEDCWFEDTFHEGNSLSGSGKIVNHHHDVFLNCGQALEAGYEGPIGTFDRCLVIGNLVGGRFGDNYTGRTYTGALNATNSILINNHRDAWAINFQDWLWRTNAIHCRSNWFTGFIPQLPDNHVWQPSSDGRLLEDFMTIPTPARVGAGFAVRSSQFDREAITNGLPVRLSSFTTNFVSVNYSVETQNQILESGVVEFAPGEIVRVITPPAVPNDSEPVRIRLQSPTNAEVTGIAAVYFITPDIAVKPLLISAGSAWRYLDTGEAADANWSLIPFDDSGWSNGVAELGYGEGDEATAIRSSGVNGRIITTYFRHAFTVPTPSNLAGLTVRLKRDDGGIVYLNGTEVFRSNISDGPVNYLTHATLAADDGKSWFSNDFSAGLLQLGTNVIAVEIHQESTTSSDVSFDLSLEASLPVTLQWLHFNDEWVLAWSDSNYVLEQSQSLGSDASWVTVSTSSPVTPSFAETASFYRLRKK